MDKVKVLQVCGTGTGLSVHLRKKPIHTAHAPHVGAICTKTYSKKLQSYIYTWQGYFGLYTFCDVLQCLTTVHYVKTL